MKACRVFLGLVVGASAILAARTSDAACPITVAPTSALIVPADTPKVGDAFTVSFASPSASPPNVAVCLDGAEALAVAASDVTTSATDARVKIVKLTMPVTLSRPAGLLAEMHVLRVQFTDDKGVTRAAQGVFHGQCPIAAKPSVLMFLNPDLPQTAFSFTATIPRVASSNEIDACYDDTEHLAVTPADVTISAQSTIVQLLIPATDRRPGGALPIGDHPLRVQFADQSGRVSAAFTLMAHKPKLASVGVVPLTAKNHAFRVSLKGDGFDAATLDNNKILIDDAAIDVCWDGATCNASPTAVQGSVAGPHEIQLVRMDPVQEARGSFRVCFSDLEDRHCSDAASDAGAWPAHLAVFSVAFAVMLLVVAGVAFLVRYGKKGVVIAGRSYLTRALLLDTETDTYSLSKFQFYVWTAVAVFGYAYLAISRNFVQYWAGLPPIPDGLPGIVAIAAGTSVGAQVVTAINGPKGAGKLHPSLGDLVTSGDVVGADRVQLLVWTVIGALGFFVVVARLDPRAIVDLPEVPSSLLAISGISAFGYLGGKLARNSGPVINEIIIRKGPDPDPKAGAAGAPAAATPDAGLVAKIAAAAASITKAKQDFAAVVQASAIQPVLTSVKVAVDAAVAAAASAAALSATSAAADLAAARTAVETQFAASQQAVTDTARALTALKAQAGLAAGDRTAADAAAAAATSAVNGAESLRSALQPPASGATASPAAPTSFGIIDIRGRTLSQDATFKISTGEDSAPQDIQLMFDKLEPAPGDEKRVQKPRVIEQDPDAGTDMTLAKRLMLVVRLDKTLEPLFAAGTTHTITLVNPDSQKVVFKFTVPATS